MYESFLTYKDGRYLIWASVISVISVVLFVLHQPSEPPNGGTWLGYTLGTVGALLIVWLSWFGVRKRSYTSTMGSVEGWLSGHVYFGAALLIVVSLHTAGELGWNVHSLAYILMCIVILSGFYGVYLYRNYPRRMAINLAGNTREEILEEIADLDRRSQRLIARTRPDVQSVVQSALERTTLAGNFRSRLFGDDGSKVMLPSPDHGSVSRLVTNRDQKAVLAFLSEEIAQSRGGDETLALRDLVDLFSERRRLLAVLRNDTRMRSRLSAWLMLHVPATFAVLAALTVHIVSVFLYW